MVHIHISLNDYQLIQTYTDEVNKLTPVKKFESKRNSSKLLIEPSCVGIVPQNPLFCDTMNDKEEGVHFCKDENYLEAYIIHTYTSIRIMVMRQSTGLSTHIEP